MKLKTEILLIFSIVSIAIISFSGLFYFFNARKALINQISNQLESLAESKKLRIADIIDTKEEALRAILNLPLIRENIFFYQSRNDEKYLEPVKRALANSKIDFVSFNEIHIFSNEGKLIVSTNPLETEASPFFLNFLNYAKSRKKFTEDFYITKEKKLGLYISSPLRYKNSIIGIVVVESSTDEIIQACSDYTGLGKTGEVILGKYDKAGKIIYVTPTRFGQTEFLKVKEKEKVNDQNYAMNRALSKQQKFFVDVTDYRGEKVFASTRYIAKPDLGLVTKIDKEEGLGVLDYFKTMTILISVVIIGILFGLSFLFANRFVKPILILADKAEKVSRGDLSQRVNIDRNNELGVLADSFNNMTEKLGVAKKAMDQKVEELDRSNDALNRFAYVVSHDLKAPLNSISGLSDLLKSEFADKLDKSGQEMLELLQGQTIKMGNLIIGVLEYSRVGGEKSSKEWVELYEVIQNVKDIINLPETIEISIENQLPRIYIQKVLMHQVFQNLIGNAIKYMDKPKGFIKIGSITENGFYKIYVADNGPGIQEKYFVKIFDIFHTINPKNNSTGVGLAIVKKIIENNHGKIWVESELGKSTTFYFTLPIGDHF